MFKIIYDEKKLIENEYNEMLCSTTVLYRLYNEDVRNYEKISIALTEIVEKVQKYLSLVSKEFLEQHKLVLGENNIAEKAYLNSLSVEEKIKLIIEYYLPAQTVLTNVENMIQTDKENITYKFKLDNIMDINGDLAFNIIKYSELFQDGNYDIESLEQEYFIIKEESLSKVIKSYKTYNCSEDIIDVYEEKNETSEEYNLNIKIGVLKYLNECQLTQDKQEQR